MNENEYFLLKTLSKWRPIELAESRLPFRSEGSIQSLIEVLDHLENIQTVTLDIFDTLIRRDIAFPEQSQKEALHLVSLIMGRHGHDLEISTLVQWRAEAEANARQIALTEGWEAEATLTEILASLYSLINERLNFDIELFLSLEVLIEYELSREIFHTSPMPGAIELLTTLKARGIQVLLISDMYLEQMHLKRILSYHGLLEGVEALYVSSTLRRSKGSGGLFSYLVKSGKIKPSRTLHIGDHPVADQVRPAEYGIDSRILQDPDEFKRRDELEQAQRLSERFGDTSHLRRIAGEQTFDEASARQIGYQRLGPIFTLFALDILDEAMRSPCRQIFFLARDGFLLKRLYQKLRAGLHLAQQLETPEGDYLYLSRASTRLAALKGHDDELLAMAQRVNRQDGSGAVLSLLGLQDDPVLRETAAELNGDDSLQAMAALQRQLLNTPGFREQVEQAMSGARERIYGYLLQHHFFGPDRVLLVDIGWNGSILATLEQLFGQLPHFPEVTARLFGRRYGIPFERIKVASGFAYDEHRPNPIEQLINEARELFETVAASCEGSVIGYEHVDGVIVPLLAEGSAHGREQVDALQQGILDYCDDFICLFNRFGPPSGALKAEASIEAASLILGNSAEERALLAGLPLDIGWGREETVTLEEYLGKLGGSDGSPLELNLSLSDNTVMSDTQGLFERILAMVERLRGVERLVFYGVGTVTQVIAPLLIDRIAYFVDGNSNLHGKTFLERTIHSPESLANESNATLFVTLLNRKQVIARRVGGYGLKTLFADDLLE